MMLSGIARLTTASLLLSLLLGTARAPQSAGNAIPSINAALPGYIRVLLSEDGKSQFAGGKLQWLDGTSILGTTDKATEVLLVNDKLRVRIGGKARDAERLVAVPLSGDAIYDSRSYRGRFEFFRGKGGGLVVLNVLPLEDYLCGVVPYEMPSSWDAEALKAQAIAARTYALSRISRQQEASYDVVATVSDQVYRGLSGEAESTNRAVRETAGLILIYQGEPISAMFCSDAGGCTQRGQAPYLQAVASFNPQSKHNRWEYPLSLDSLLAMAKEDGLSLGQPQVLTTVNDPVSGHIETLTLRGSKGEWSIGGNDLRRRLGYSNLKSTRAMAYLAQAAGGPPPLPQSDSQGLAQLCFAPGSASANLQSIRLGASEASDVLPASGLESTRPAVATGRPPSRAATSQEPLVTSLKLEPGSKILLVGSGYGHGHGMSQYGAAELARQAWSYDRILLYFYRGVELVQLPELWLKSGQSGWPAPVATEAADENAVSIDFYTPYKARSS